MILTTAVAVLLQSCLSQQGTQPAGVEVLGRGNQCGETHAGAYWLDADALERLAMDPREGHHVLLISRGERPTGGYGVSLDEATLEKGRVRVRLHLAVPSEDELVTQAITRPCLVLGIPGEAGVVELRDHDDGLLSELEVP